jgi:hypothetical protein
MKIKNSYKFLFAIVLIIGILFALPNTVFADEEQAIIKWDLNGGSGDLPPDELVNWGIYYELPNECTFIPPEGKMFAHWYIYRYYGEKNGLVRRSGLCHRNPGESFNTDRNTYFSDMGYNIGFIIQPTWVDKTTVTLNPNGGTVDPTSLILPNDYETEYGVLPTPIRDGFSFGGWQRKLPLKSMQMVGSSELRISPSEQYYNGYTGSKGYQKSAFKDGDIIFFDLTVEKATISSVDCNDGTIQASNYTISQDGHNIRCKFVYGHRNYDYDFIDIHVSNKINPDEDVIVNQFYVLSNVAKGARAYPYKDYTLTASWNHDEHDYQFHEGYSASYDADGYLDHYTCDCGKYFIKENDEYIEVQKEDITLPRLVVRYPLWIGKTRVSNVNADDILGDGRVSFNTATNTLYLDNATIKDGGNTKFGWGINYRGTDDFTIVCEGINNVSDTVTRSRMSAGVLIGDPEYSYSTSVCPVVTITLNENAELIADGANVYNSSDYHYSLGFYNSSYKNMLINGKGSITARSGNGKEGDESNEYCYLYGLCANGNATFENGGAVTCKGGDNSYCSYGIYCGSVTVNKPLSEFKLLQAIGGYGDYSYGIKGSEFTLTNGYVTATAANANYGSYALGTSHSYLNGGHIKAYSINTLNDKRALYSEVTLGNGIGAVGNRTNYGGSISDCAEIYNEYYYKNYIYFEAGKGVTHTVTFNTDGGSKIDDVVVIHEGKVTRSAYDPTKNKFEFDNYYTDKKYDTLFDFENTVINADTEIFVHWNYIYIFPDVTYDKWYGDGVKFVKDYNLMSGYSGGDKDGLFGPDDLIKRGQIATILYRMAGSPYGETDENTTLVSNFPDVQNKKSYYYKAVIWANEKGIVTGYTSGKNVGKFGPNDYITRQQLATMIYRYVCYVENRYIYIDINSLNDFSDKDEVSDYALIGMQFAVQNNIITGKEIKEGDVVVSTILAPKDTAKRSEVATMIMRFCQKVLYW